MDKEKVSSIMNLSTAGLICFSGLSIGIFDEFCDGTSARKDLGEILSAIPIFLGGMLGAIIGGIDNNLNNDKNENPIDEEIKKFYKKENYAITGAISGATIGGVSIISGSYIGRLFKNMLYYC